MEYSKIKKIKTVNFRSIGSIEIDMTDSPIVALTGTNEGGKSSIIYAFGAAAGNLRRTKHNQYIRTGTDGWASLIELENATKVLRKKSSSLNGYTLVTADGQRRDATKIDVEVPDYIEAVMGLFRDPETKECLQVRTCDDPLLFVNTTDGQNYKAMHNAINNLDVREASVKAKADASALLAEAEKKRSEVDIYKKQLAELPLLDTDYLKIVLSALERASEISAKFDSARKSAELVASLDGVGDAKKLKKCKTVDAEAVRLFTDALRHLDIVRTNTAEVEQCETISVEVVNGFADAMRYLKTMREADAVCYDNVDVVDVTPIAVFERGLKFIADVKASRAYEVPDTVTTITAEALPLFEKALGFIETIKETTASIEKLTAGIKTVSTALKASGMRVISCENCGHDIAVPDVV